MSGELESTETVTIPFETEPLTTGSDGTLFGDVGLAHAERNDPSVAPKAAREAIWKLLVKNSRRVRAGRSVSSVLRAIGRDHSLGRGRRVAKRSQSKHAATIAP